MFIVMHCGGIPFNGNTIKTQSLGGSESAAYYMARELSALGHRVTLFTNSEQSGIFDGVRYEFAGNISAEAVLGDRFKFYAENTPHDVCIIQRHPQAFHARYASKVNLWWLHDLALKRNEHAALSGMINVDGVLVVSEYHKKQVVETWGLSPEVVFPITNGIDLSLFDKEVARDPFALFYSSRPERGLIHLVGEGGIMQRLHEMDSRFHLAVCAYDNRTPQTEQLYDYLDARCEALPNVEQLGSLTKDQLAELMMSCGAWIYPTNFEEVSCITAMEAMAAGCNIIASDHAALPETCAGSGATLIPLKGGEPDRDAFISAVLTKASQNGTRASQRSAALFYTWAKAAQRLSAVFNGMMGADKFLPETVRSHLIRTSDIALFRHYDPKKMSPVIAAQEQEYELGYAFYQHDKFAEHYEAFYEYEKDRGINYGPEDITGNTRFRAVSNMLSDLPAGSFVLDYGCAHGHYTITLAKAYPNLFFVGHDLASSNIDKARAWAAQDGVSNVSFHHGDHATVIGEFHAIIAAEVIEHVAHPIELVDSLAERLCDGGRMIITTPYGPWEAQGYAEHLYWRAHLHHFDRQDLHEAFGHHPGFGITAAPTGIGAFGTVMGSYITTFRKPVEPSRPVKYDRKLAEMVPQQTLSVCMIVKNAESDIRRCLESVMPVATEVIIAVDESTEDNTRHVIQQIQEENPLVAWQVFKGSRATEVGFAEARNTTIAKANCDWILWIDSDEVMVDCRQIFPAMRSNQFKGYAVKQHHFSVQPAGILKTDLPVRLFRSNLGIKFFGFVHEHPEIAMNEGVGAVCLLPGAEIAHHGYTTEPVRRTRFSRNIGLLVRDRKENPNRILGKFLWLRDLAQMNQYDIEYRRADPVVMTKRAEEGVELWRDILKTNLRMAVDGLPYYSELVGILGGGFEFSFAVDAKRGGRASASSVASIDGLYASLEDASSLMNAVLKDRTAGFDSRYF